MTPEVLQAPDPESAQMGAFARITGVFFEPGKTFADIGRRPQWFLPLLLIVLSAIAFYAVYGQRVGWERFMQQQLATSPGRNSEWSGFRPNSGRSRWRSRPSSPGSCSM